MLVLTIGNAKNVEEMKFNTDYSMLKYLQDTLNSCCSSILEPAYKSTNQIKAENSISKRIE